MQSVQLLWKYRKPPHTDQYLLFDWSSSYELSEPCNTGGPSPQVKTQQFTFTSKIGCTLFFFGQQITYFLYQVVWERLFTSKKRNHSSTEEEGLLLLTPHIQCCPFMPYQEIWQPFTVGLMWQLHWLSFRLGLKSLQLFCQDHDKPGGISDTEVEYLGLSTHQNCRSPVHEW